MEMLATYSLSPGITQAASRHARQKMLTEHHKPSLSSIWRGFRLFLRIFLQIY